MPQIVSPKGQILTRFFTVKGINFEIVGAIGNGSLWNTLDVIENVETKSQSKIKRSELIKYNSDDR